MKFRFSILTVGLAIAMFSCKDKSASGDATTDTLSNTTTTTSEARTVTVPAPVKTSFETKYPTATNVRWDYYQPSNQAYIDWEWSGWPAMDTLDYVATYNWEGNDYMSWYDEQGNWIGTVNVVTDYNNGLPAPVNNVINKQYSGYTITSVKRENDKDRVAYEIELNNNATGAKGKLLIDEKGNILKKKLDSESTESKEKMNPKDSQ